jgi:cell division protein FtsB
MADTVTDTRPTFSRLTEGKATQSWRSAIPIVVILVAIVALLAYLASNISSSSQRAAVAERDANQYREQITSITKQVGDLQKEVTLARSPGRTTVVLQAAQPATSKKSKSAAPPANSAWASVTWGELPNGKSWMRVNAYGLQQNLEGKTYHVWMQPASGDPVDVGALDVDQNGSGFAMGSNLPAIDQGKAVMLTTDASGAKQPGDIVAKADLPKLQPTMQQAPAGQAQNAGQGQATPQGENQATTPAKPQGDNQAKSSGDTQRMHQNGK